MGVNRCKRVAQSLVRPLDCWSRGFSSQRGEAWERITEKNRAWTKLAWRREKVQPNDNADWKYALYSEVAFKQLSND